MKCLQLPERVKVVGFADYIVVLVVAKHIHEAEAAANEDIWKIKSWLETAGLVLADYKAEAVLIPSPKTLEYFNIRVVRRTIRSKEAVKYLGALFDNRLRYKVPVDYIE